jgi:hypothetical protein
MTALLFDILTEIRLRIGGRNLPGLASANIVVQKVPANRPADLPARQFPCILITPHGAEQLPPERGTNLRDDVVYPVRLAILAADAGDQETHFRQYLTWRQSLRQLFHNQPLGELCFQVRVEPLEVVDADLWRKQNLFVSQLVLHCTAREPRG